MGPGRLHRIYKAGWDLAGCTVFTRHSDRTVCPKETIKQRLERNIPISEELTENNVLVIGPNLYSVYNRSVNGNSHLHLGLRAMDIATRGWRELAPGPPLLSRITGREDSQHILFTLEGDLYFVGRVARHIKKNLYGTETWRYSVGDEDWTEVGWNDLYLAYPQPVATVGSRAYVVCDGALWCFAATEGWEQLESSVLSGAFVRRRKFRIRLMALGHYLVCLPTTMSPLHVYDTVSGTWLEDI
ncbi:hypothetical protein KIPB_010592, partial [Kipferlia bialata]|eukprot:g10592.t1